MPRYEELSAKSAFTTFEEVAGEAEPKWHERGKLMSFNAYHGARAIAEALDRGAQIVITGISLSLFVTRPPARVAFASPSRPERRSLCGQRAGARPARPRVQVDVGRPRPALEWQFGRPHHRMRLPSDRW